PPPPRSPLFPYTTLFRSRTEPDSPPLGVLVGFDGSDQSVRALYYAARAARRLDSRLSVVTAYTVPNLAYADASLTPAVPAEVARDRKSTRLNSSHVSISY